MKITKATSIQYVIETILGLGLTANEIKVFNAWFCDKWGFNPTASEIAKRCGITESAASTAFSGLCTKNALSFQGKVPTPSGKLKNTYGFGSIFKESILIEGQAITFNKSESKDNTAHKRLDIWYVEKWPHIKSEAERLIPEIRKYVKFNSTMKKIAKLEGYKNAISTQIESQSFKFIDYKIANFTCLGNALVRELNEYIYEYDLELSLFPCFEVLKSPTKKTPGTNKPNPKSQSF